MVSRARKPKSSHCSPSERKALSRTEWTSVLNVLSEAISIHSDTGLILWANDKLCEIYSRTLPELRRINCQQAFHREGERCEHAQASATGRKAQLEDEVHVAGKVWSVMIMPTPERGRPGGFVRVMRDVTEGRRVLQESLEVERFTTLGQMLFGIAHDVGTPLNIISGYAEYLIMKKGPGDSGHKELSTILDQTKRISAILREALDLARPSRGRTAPLEMKALLGDALHFAAHYLRSAGVATRLTCGIDAPLIYGEAAELRRAFFSVVLNASESVGCGGRLEIVLEETPGVASFLSVTISGTNADGGAHDFSQSLASLSAGRSELSRPGSGLTLAGDILDRMGARVRFGCSDVQGVPIVIDLPMISRVEE